MDRWRHRFATTGICAIATCIAVPGPTQAAAPTEVQFERAALHIETRLWGSMMRDSQGFLWFATTGLGVLRFDGREFQRFAGGQDDQNGLSGPMVGSMVEDSRGDLWFATFNHGLTQYKRHEGRFIHHRHRPDDAHSLATDKFAFTPGTLLSTPEGRLWAGTEGGGLHHFDLESQTWTRHAHGQRPGQGLVGSRVQALARDPQGQIWVGTQNGGISVYDPKRGQWSHHGHNPQRSGTLADNWVYGIAIEGDGTVWAATRRAGLSRLAPNQDTWQHFRANPANKPLASDTLAHDEIWSLYLDGTGHLWLCHPGGPVGLSRLDTQTLKFIHYPAGPGQALSSSDIRGIIRDPENEIIWVANYDGRIDRADPRRPQFHTLRHIDGDPTSLQDELVESIHEDKEQRLWLGTAKGGLHRLRSDRRSVEFFPARPEIEGGLPKATVKTITDADEGQIWLGLRPAGICRFDIATQRCVRYFQHETSDPASLTESRFIKSLVVDPDDPQILWVATVGGGLDRFDRRTQKFHHHRHRPDDPGSIRSNILSSLALGPESELWVSTYGGGLNVLDRNTGTFRHFAHDPDDPQSIASDTLYQVFVSSAGTIYVVGDAGLSRYDRSSRAFTNYDRSTGLSSNSIGAVFEDAQGILWMSTTDAGLMRFDPNTQQTRTFSVSDGLQGDSFLWNSGARLADGSLWFGGSHGVTGFHPLEITRNERIPEIRLTALTQSGRPLPKLPAPPLIKALRLEGQNNYFEFKFAALNYTSPADNQYAYMLEGWDHDWYFAGNAPSGRYSGLSGGRYTLRLKGSNNDGTWNHEGVSIDIEVVPPFWRTWYFFALLAALSTALTASAVLYTLRLRREISHRRRAEAQRQDLEEQLRHSQKMDAMGQLAGGVAHDFNNALTVILGNTELAVLDLEKIPGAPPGLQESLEQIRSGANHASALTQQLLAFGRRDTNDLEVIEINHTLSRLKKMIRSLISEDIRITLELQTAPLYTEVDAHQFDQVLINLAVNARDAMSGGGQLRLRAGAFKLSSAEAATMPDAEPGHFARIEVRDTGDGMSLDVSQRIFEPYFTTKERGKGTGLGLSIVYGIVRRAGGYLSVQSREGEGSTIAVHLPLSSAPQASAQSTTWLPRPMKKEGGSILVCEDQAAVLQLASRALGNAGYTVHTASTTRTALALAREHRLELRMLITDLVLPDMSGQELAQALVDAAPELRVLYMSGYTEDALEARGIWDAQAAMIAKPFTPAQLVARVQTILGPPPASGSVATTQKRDVG